MTNILFFFTALLSAAGIALYEAHTGVFPFLQGKWGKRSEALTPFSRKTMILLILIVSAASCAVQISLYRHTEAINFAKLYGLFLIVTAAALTDAKTRRIPNELILTGLFLRAGLYLYELTGGEPILEIVVNDLLGLAAGFGILFVASLLTKGAVGMGDAKLFAVIGITGGFYCTYSTLLLSLLVSTLVALVGIAMKRMDRKTAIPFGPAIAIGYALTVLLTSY